MSYLTLKDLHHDASSLAKLQQVNIAIILLLLEMYQRALLKVMHCILSQMTPHGGPTLGARMSQPVGQSTGFTGAPRRQ